LISGLSYKHQASEEQSERGQAFQGVIRLGWKILLCTNTLAYSSRVSAAKKKSLIILIPG
jgi:hypothetical protein